MKALELLEKVLSDSNLSKRIRGITQNDIGWIYLIGRGGVEKNYKLALKYNIRAGKNGQSHAYSNVALIYFAGLGVEQDYYKMVNYLILSLENFSEGDDWILEEKDEWLDSGRRLVRMD